MTPINRVVAYVLNERLEGWMIIVRDHHMEKLMKMGLLTFLEHYKYFGY